MIEINKVHSRDQPEIYRFFMGDFLRICEIFVRLMKFKSKSCSILLEIEYFWEVLDKNKRILS